METIRFRNRIRTRRSIGRWRCRMSRTSQLVGSCARNLLEIHPDEAAAEDWTWRRIETALHEAFGLAVPPATPDPVDVLGQHFFPGILQREGFGVAPAQRQWRVGLPLVDTSPLMWNVPPDRPFRDDAASQELWCELPLRDERVVERLAELRQLNLAEQAAVQDLFFAPNTTLAPFAAIFEDFPRAAAELIAIADEAERFAVFRRAFALFDRRCRVIAAHLAGHVAHVTRRPGHDRHEEWRHEHDRHEAGRREDGRRDDDRHDEGATNTIATTRGATNTIATTRGVTNTIVTTRSVANMIATKRDGANTIITRTGVGKSDVMRRGVTSTIGTKRDVLSTIVTRSEREALDAVAWRVLRSLHADENFATSPWEEDSGVPPGLTYGPQPSGSAFAALLGLTGTGLLGTFTPHGSVNPVWRETRGPLSAFGHERNEWNAPVPTIIPALGLTLTPALKRFVAIRNGFAMRDINGEPLGGAERFSVTWEGVLLIEHGGEYRFDAGTPTPDGEDPHFDPADPYRWRLRLRRGQRTWVMLNHRWPSQTAPPARSAPLGLQTGTYTIIAELDHDQPDFADPAMIHTADMLDFRSSTPARTATTGRSRSRCAGFSWPTRTPRLDTGLASAMRARPDRSRSSMPCIPARCGTSVGPISAPSRRCCWRIASACQPRATASAVKARLSWTMRRRSTAPRQCAPDRPASNCTAPGWISTSCRLPTRTHPPNPAADSRAAPSAARRAAMFDWWERLFDYATMRRQAHAAHERSIWRLFFEGAENQPDDPAQLLRHLGVDILHALLVTMAISTCLRQRSADRCRPDRRTLASTRGSGNPNDGCAACSRISVRARSRPRRHICGRPTIPA